MTRKEREILYRDMPYGVYITGSGEHVLYNRAYQPLDEPDRWVEDIVEQWTFYDDGHTEEEKFERSAKQMKLHKVV